MIAILLLSLVPFQEHYMEPVTLKVGLVGRSHLYANHLDLSARIRLCRCLREVTMPDRPNGDSPEWVFTTYRNWERDFDDWVDQIMIRGYVVEHRWWLLTDWDRKKRVFRQYGFEITRKE